MSPTVVSNISRCRELRFPQPSRSARWSLIGGRLSGQLGRLRACQAHPAPPPEAQGSGPADARQHLAGRAAGARFRGAEKRKKREPRRRLARSPDGNGKVGKDSRRKPDCALLLDPCSHLPPPSPLHKHAWIPARIDCAGGGTGSRRRRRTSESCCPGAVGTGARDSKGSSPPPTLTDRDMRGASASPRRRPRVMKFLRITGSFKTLRSFVRFVWFTACASLMSPGGRLASTAPASLSLRHGGGTAGKGLTAPAGGPAGRGGRQNAAWHCWQKRT